jgi:porphobilinogen synthase
MSYNATRPQFPGTRLRRLRSSAGIRDMVQETRLTVSDLIWPLFVVEGDKVEEPIPSLPGVNRYSIDKIIEQAQLCVAPWHPRNCPISPHARRAKRRARNRSTQS